MSKTVYLDYQASKPVAPEVFEAMKPYFTQKFANASSLHTDGDIATDALDDSRKVIAQFVNAKEPREIIFTNSATASNNLALIGYALRIKKRENILSFQKSNISLSIISENIYKRMDSKFLKFLLISTEEFGLIS